MNAAFFQASDNNLSASQVFVFWGYLKEVLIAPKMTIRYFEVKNGRNSFISSPIFDLV